MNIDFAGVQRIDEVKHHDKVVMVDSSKREVSRLREKGHSPYRCTRGFRTRKEREERTED